MTCEPIPIRTGGGCGGFNVSAAGPEPIKKLLPARGILSEGGGRIGPILMHDLPASARYYSRALSRDVSEPAQVRIP